MTCTRIVVREVVVPLQTYLVLRGSMYGRTDRERPTVSCHVADAHSSYDLRISRLFTPLRTFELDGAPPLEQRAYGMD